jgi:AraC-like DNA-binding protein
MRILPQRAVVSPAPRMVSALGVRQLLMFGVRHGLDPEDLCAAAGIAEQQLKDGRAHVPYAWAGPILESLITSLPDIPVGLELGLFASLDQLGYLGHAVKYCGSPLAAMRLVSQCAPLIDSLYLELPASVTVDAERVTWALPSLRHDPHDWGEAVLVKSVAALRALVGADLAPLEVHLSRTDDARRALYEGFFAAPVRFGRQTDALVFERALLERPLQRSDLVVQQRFVDHFEKIMGVAHDRLALAVRAAIEAELGGGMISQSRVAKQLGMSVRHLQRKLKEREIPYHRLAAQARQALAARLLLDPSRNVAAVARAVGYNESSFHRVFRRWTGMSPSAFRSAQRRRERG